MRDSYFYSELEFRKQLLLYDLHLPQVGSYGHGLRDQYVIATLSLRDSWVIDSPVFRL